MVTYATMPPEWLTLQSATTSELSKRNVDPKGTGGGQSSDGTQCPDSRNGGKSFNETSSNEGTSNSGSRSRNGASNSNKDSGSDDPCGTPDKLSQPQPRVLFANPETFPGETQAQQIENPSLQRNGPHSSKGSDKHDAGTCKPCAFYCFSQGGCKNGTACEFCHLSHESRSRKKDVPAKAPEQPSKPQGSEGRRKNGDSRRRVVFGDSSIITGKPAHEAAVLYDLQDQQLTVPPGIMAPVTLGMADDLTSSPAPKVFSYTPSPVVVAVGQQVELWPGLTGSEPRVFAVAPELPRGLTIDKLSGVIHGTAQEATGMPIIFFVTCCEPRFNFHVSTAVVHVNVLNNNASGYQHEARVCASALHEDANILEPIAKVHTAYDYNSFDLQEYLCQGMATQSIRPPRLRQPNLGFDASSYQ